MDTLDEFYPPSLTLRCMREGKGVEGVYANTLRRLSDRTRIGDYQGEVNLARMVGQIRRHFPEWWEGDRSHDELREALSEAVDALREVGRKVNLRSDDPREWVSARDGGPRWE